MLAKQVRKITLQTDNNGICNPMMKLEERKKACGKQAELINTGCQLQIERFHKGKSMYRRVLQTHAYK